MTGRPRSTAPKRDELIKVLVTLELHDRVAEAAKREGRSVSDWGMRAFEQALGPISPASPPPVISSSRKRRH